MAPRRTASAPTASPSSAAGPARASTPTTRSPGSTGPPASPARPARASSSRRTSRSPSSGASSPPTSSSASTSAATSARRSARPASASSSTASSTRSPRGPRPSATSRRTRTSPTFKAELTHLLVHQKMAFNSPVWFNVGIEAEAAVLRVLHQLGPGQHALDHGPRQDRGHAVQVRLGRRRQPVPDPLLQGEDDRRRHRVGPGQLHARLRRVRRASSSRAARPAARPRW